MKRVLNKKLNRTVVFKESTQWAYLSSQSFLDFFQEKVENLKPLPKSQKDFDLFLKKEFLTEDNPQPIKMHLVYCPNNGEIRVNGEKFADCLRRLNACECDNLVFETYEKDNLTYFLLSVAKRNNIVMTKYSKNDIKKNVDTLNEEYLKYWWFWDNNLTETEMNDFINNQHTVNYLGKKESIEKIIKFKEITTFSKFMSDSKGRVDKVLYEIYEKFGDDWIPADFDKLKLLEFELQDGNYTVINRRDNDLEYLEIGV